MGLQHLPSLSVAWFASSSGGSRDSRGLSSPKETDASSHDSCSYVSTFRRIYFSLSLSYAWLFHVCFLCEEHVLKLNRVGTGHQKPVCPGPASSQLLNQGAGRPGLWSVCFPHLVALTSHMPFWPLFHQLLKEGGGTTSDDHTK